MNEIKQRLIDLAAALKTMQHENDLLCDLFVKGCIAELEAAGIEVPEYTYCHAAPGAEWSLGDHGRLTVDGRLYSRRDYIGHLKSHDVTIYGVDKGYDTILFILHDKRG